jgi:hypothetical protein
MLPYMPRNPSNPVKLRAQQRATDLGKTLLEVYKEAHCHKAYLSSEPKTGWRENKLRAIARALDWSFDDLMQGPRAERDRQPDGSDHLELAIEIMVDVLRAGLGAGTASPQLAARLTRSLHDYLRQQAVAKVV